MNQCLQCNRLYIYIRSGGCTKTFCNSCVTARKRKRDKEQFRAILGDRCSQCGYNKCIAGLHFHHLNPSDKEFNMSEGRQSKENQLKEIQKCILLCSNCHQELHHPDYNGLLD